MTTKLHVRPSSVAYWSAAGVVCIVGLVAGRSLSAGAAAEPPAIEDLRPAPNMYAIAARPSLPPAELARSVDAIGLVRVDSVEAVKDITAESEFTGEQAWGRGLVTATVIESVVGSEAALASFAFSATFVPNSDEFAISNIDPPLEVGAEYLLFLEDGLVVFPGGEYRVTDGKVWNIGHWHHGDAREYPHDLSGLTVRSALDELERAVGR